MGEVNQKRVQELIQSGRDFMRGSDSKYLDEVGDYETDQYLKKQQPPLFKESMGGKITVLPRNFRDLGLSNDILEILYRRKSSRVYTAEKLSLLELSYLLWATQGVKNIRGKNFATLRTVACGGARHEFECYMMIKNVEGLECGYYHYMPDKHAVEQVKILDEKHLTKEIETVLCGQRWACKSNVVFLYSIIPYRCEWRYGIWAHRAALMDSGHITQNLYIACSSAGLGTCAVASLETEYANQMFELDGEEEFIFYAATVGKIAEDYNKAEEDEIYAFLHEN